MKDLLKKFEDKKPEVVFHWSDSETEAEGWAVINSLRGGAAGGGQHQRQLPPPDRVAGRHRGRAVRRDPR